MITLPVIVFVFVTLSLGFGAALGQHRIQQLASDHARVLSFGGDPALLPGVPPEAKASVQTAQDLVCVEYHQLYREGAWRALPLELRARACALAPPLE
jgi:hypothetical protein